MLSEKLDRLRGYATVAPGTLFGRIADSLSRTMLKAPAVQSAIASCRLLAVKLKALGCRIDCQEWYGIMRMEIRRI